MDIMSDAPPKEFVRCGPAWRVIALLLATAVAACGNARSNEAGSGESTQAAQAARLFEDNCAGCHGPEAAVAGAPTRDAIGKLASPTILAALDTGVMREQAAHLSPAERAMLANWLGAEADRKVSATESGKRCNGTLRLSQPLWNRWGNGLDNRRQQSVAAGGITAANVGSLELKWAFAFPGAARARSQPAVTREAIFTGSQSGRVYALDPETGCIWWTFDAEGEVRSAPTLGIDAGGRVDRLYFGDFNANVYALDAATGQHIWTTKVKDHPAGTITGSPTLHDGRLYVPMSSTEVVSAHDPDYECCTFRGGVVALDAARGNPVWRIYTVPEATRQGVNRNGVPAFGPSGAPIWSTPTVDSKRGLLYVGTGENYSSPANEMSDAIIAMELTTGRVRWVRQTIAGDAWNASCGPRNNRINCPAEDGPDFDFGAPPVLVTLPGGKDMILAGQKSGMVYGLDPDDGGRIVWQQRAGMGGYNGGIHWGMASDGRTLFVGIADTPGHQTPTGPPRPGLHAFDVATGKPLWSRIEPPTCDQPTFACQTALSAPLTLTGELVFAGAHNGLLRVYSAHDGGSLWTFNTRRAFETVNGVKGIGGTIDSAGAVVAGGRVIVNSGYDKFGEIPGNVLLVFAIKPEGDRK
jgi:polyvinyl alcohol dehydrogenase (cytochrome)